MLFNLFNKDKMHYSGFKIRFVKFYNWIDNIPPTEDEVHFFEDKICPFFSKNLYELAGKLNITFYDSNRTYYDNDGLYGNFIRFPSFYYRNGASLNGNLRINPCISSQYPKDKKHYSKIWCIVESNKKIRQDGEQVLKSLKSARELCIKATKSVGDYFLQFVSESPDVQEYWTSIESVVISSSDSKKKGIESLFITDDKERFLKIYNSSSASKRSLSDIAEWIYEQEIADPLSFITKKKDPEIEWRVLQDPDADIFYAQKNTDKYLHLLGLGISKNKKEDIVAIDRAFLPQVANLISEL